MRERGVATNGGADISPKTQCPNCMRLQQVVDQRWVELQDLRARVLGLEGMLSEYVWLVSESAADELDPDAWNERVAQARSNALRMLDSAAAARPTVEAGRELGSTR